MSGWASAPDPAIPRVAGSGRTLGLSGGTGPRTAPGTGVAESAVAGIQHVPTRLIGQ
ncbi:hypothetical protein PV779_61100 [Streptomyces sp. ID01-9D]|nr:hypothetical protein [Streptomyces sp. ID01-9D]